MKRKTVSVIRYAGFLYDRVAMWECFMFLFRKAPELCAVPLVLGDGSLMAPGDRFAAIGGKKTSAGFTSFKMLPGYALEYAGKFSDLTGTALCFHQVADGQRSGLEMVGPLHGYAAAFYGWMDTGIDGQWVYSTPAVAGRVVETNMIVRA